MELKRSALHLTPDILNPSHHNTVTCQRPCSRVQPPLRVFPIRSTPLHFFPVRFTPFRVFPIRLTPFHLSLFAEQYYTCSLFAQQHLRNYLPRRRSRARAQTLHTLNHNQQNTDSLFGRWGRPCHMPETMQPRTLHLTYTAVSRSLATAHQHRSHPPALAPRLSLASTLRWSWGEVTLRPICLRSLPSITRNRSCLASFEDRDDLRAR